MGKRGFTLIELLAVILILGIITLIAIPTVNNIIGESRKGSFKSTLDQINKAIGNECTIEQIKNLETTKNYVISNGVITPSIDIKGALPDGDIYVDDECSITFNLHNNYFVGTKESSDNNIEIVKYDGSYDSLGYVTPPDRCFDTSNNADGTLTITKYKCGNSLKIHSNENRWVPIFNNDGEFTKIIIPKSIGNKNVTEIKNFAFSIYSDNNYNFTIGDKVGVLQVIIPDGIKSIRESTFDSNQLINVIIPNSVKSIEKCAFLNNQLITINIPNSITSIGDYAFYTNKLTSIILPTGNITYGDVVFGNNNFPNKAPYNECGIFKDCN